jgi:serine/threonine protein kinase
MLGSALLMDFGIAKSMADYSATNSGLMVGTPTYMSPEQASGDDVVDSRSDIYSLGVLAYHMLCGRPPFVGRTAQQVITAHVTERPQPIRKVNPSVPYGLASAIEKCLEKAPEDRFQDAMQLSEALQQVTFGIEAERAIHEPKNYAMPFFAGLALAFDIFATLGAARIGGLSSRELWYFTGGFAILALMTSPVARAATVPLSAELSKLLSRWSGRLRLRRGEP